MTTEVETPDTPGRGGTFRRLLPWAVVACLAAPPTIVLHELGHYAAARAFRFPGVSLHYGSVDDGAEASGAPAWQRGVKSAAGPVVTLLLVLASVAAARRAGARPLTAAPGFAAGVRSVLIAGGYLFFLATQGRPTRGNFDEANTARALGLPVELVVAPFAAAVLAGWVAIARLIPARGRWAVLASVAAGTAAGVGLWAVVGPRILP